MERIFKIFISATKRTLEFERSTLIDALLLQNCIPITMEYFINPNRMPTLEACIKAIDKSDAVILILKNRYGTKIPYDEILRSFPNGCPLKNTMCSNCKGSCELSYTHFEYRYATLKKKILYVLSNIAETSDEIQSFFDDTQSKGCYNIYTDSNSFIATSSTIVSKIIQDCRCDNYSGLIPASMIGKLPALQRRISFLESNFYNGFIPQKNFMGCLMKQYSDDLVFYVYKELQLRENRTGFDFSIHINIGDKSEVTLSKKLVEAHAYIKYKAENSKFTSFYECQIAEKSYGHEYLNCHIEFLKQNNIRLPIRKGDSVGVFYTYKVNKYLYGNEIGRQISPFFETTLVELIYSKKQENLVFDCFEKIENNLMDVEGFDSEKIKPSTRSFLLDILSKQEVKSMVLDTYKCGKFSDYTIKQIMLPEFVDEDGNRRLSHFYVKWGD